MAQPYDIVAIGECLIDFMCTQQNGKLLMEGNPGGAPANVLAMAARLGCRTALVSKVGKDHFGTFLRGHIAAAGIGTDAILQSAEHPTTLAIVAPDGSRNRSFSFYRDHTADVMLSVEELPRDMLQSARILHFGSVSLTAEPSRSATLTAASLAKQSGVLVSYDPNLRPALWRSLAEAKQLLWEGLALADIVKVSEAELLFLTDAATVEQGIEQLYHACPMQLLAVTLGPRGCIFRTATGCFSSAAFNTPCVDTTGAGDAFWGAALSRILVGTMPVSQYTEGALVAMMDFSNAAGGLAITQKGAIPAMPDAAEIAACIAHTPRLTVDSIE
ncbi:MAG: carbohydrate kinase [Ruthenibacterium sp.]